MCWLVLGCDPQKVRRADVAPILAAEHKGLVQEVLDVLDTRYDGTVASRRLSPMEAKNLLALADISLPKFLCDAIDRQTKPATVCERPKSATTKELNTLKKLLLAVAVDKFDHKPENGAAGRISETARSRGISVSDDTVRKFLEQAMSELDQIQKGNLFRRSR